ncbi:spermidine/putrescine transport system permease protein [Halopenitus malekzadehii]|uniref:Spermidine/putrescine transport system permease protein n=1 Tax=Halopenitus malekzadehii TaxID=1267564 RepID=A0A1H6I602_9EURY|nr:ABC transporter permease [Halopenitus malekzadehii]SEH43024.1 spermidine/putrescine transport system permease protein [Halopenitus malekzadehii]
MSVDATPSDGTAAEESAGQSPMNTVLNAVSGYWMPVWAILVFGFLYAPIAVLILFSFEQGTFSGFPWDGFTMQWYVQMVNDDRLIQSTLNSLYVGAFVTTGATILGTLGAIALVRGSFRRKGLFRALVIAPMTIPGLILGIALLLWFNMIGFNTSLRTVMLGQLVFVTPFVLITVSARLRGFDPELEEAARDLGASKWQTYRRVTLPILMPGIISGALFAFTLSFDDFLIAFFTSGVENTLPIYIWSKVQHGTDPVINAISAMVLLFSISLIVVSELLRQR